MQQKVLSVSIAAYNVEETLEEALTSFVNEDVLDALDIMIVDDGSKDRTAEIAKKYAQTYPDTFRLIQKENGGWGSTVNTGIRNARGTYFKQLDGDDYFSKENIVEFVRFLQERTEDAVYTPYVAFDSATGGIIRVFGECSGDYRFFAVNRKTFLCECDGLTPAMHCMTFKTEILQKNEITLTEHCFYTDVEYMLKAINNCETIVFAKWPVYCYRLARDGQSMSQAGVRKHYKDHQKMLFVMLDYMKKYVDDPYKQNMFRNRLMGACYMQYIFYLALECTAAQKRELRKFDALLKKEYPSFYNVMPGRGIQFLRKTNFFGYKIIAARRMRKDRKLRQNIFEGC